MAIAEGAAALLQLFKDSRVDDDVAEHFTLRPAWALHQWQTSPIACPGYMYELELKILMDSIDFLKDPPL